MQVMLWHSMSNTHFNIKPESSKHCKNPIAIYFWTRTQQCILYKDAKLIGMAEEKLNQTIHSENVTHYHRQMLFMSCYR